MKRWCKGLIVPNVALPTVLGWNTFSRFVCCVLGGFYSFRAVWGYLLGLSREPFVVNLDEKIVKYWWNVSANSFLNSHYCKNHKQQNRYHPIFSIDAGCKVETDTSSKVNHLFRCICYKSKANWNVLGRFLWENAARVNMKVISAVDFCVVVYTSVTNGKEYCLRHLILQCTQASSREL